jgi:hypothetical protein
MFYSTTEAPPEGRGFLMHRADRMLRAPNADKLCEFTEQRVALGEAKGKE